MKFHRVHIEITNICGLACTFCPPKSAPKTTMSLEDFAHTVAQLPAMTRVIALHLMGDPLVVSNLVDYLAIAHAHALQVELVTSGFYTHRHDAATLLHPAVRQLNFSLSSFDANTTSITLEAYLEPILALCDTKLALYPKPFINLRLWNLQENASLPPTTVAIVLALEKHFKLPILNTLDTTVPLRLESKILLDFEAQFVWPSMQSGHFSQGRCYGLESHFGILADGRVVPCCLDGEGVITLGDTHQKSILSILSSPRAQHIIEGFRADKAVEPLCQKCSYKDRFRTLSST
ncbi:MAG: radical SAM protein [Sulfuricurvum sp. PC08-66]|nr:MAG: radical SAM protein [Sulfuricurvum sp. PC08-66]